MSAEDSRQVYLDSCIYTALLQITDLSGAGVLASRMSINSIHRLSCHMFSIR